MATTKAREKTGQEIIQEAFPAHRCMWQQHVRLVGTLTCYLINATLFIVQDFDAGGWEVFSQTTQEGRIDLTVEAVATKAFGDKTRRQ